MKKQGTLNSEISSVLSYTGHMDTIAIVDCDRPIPEEVNALFHQPMETEIVPTQCLRNIPNAARQ